VGVATGDEVPGCSDPVCCEAVCAEDDFCCDVEWDEDCATFGYNNNGNGARVLCPELCGASCPEGSVEWVDPPDGVVDARQPFSPADASRPAGIETITVRAPLGADRVECWDLCETESAQSPNHVADVEDNPDGTLTILLARPITPGAVTTLTYRGSRATASFAFHPGNPNGDAQANRSDVTALLDTLTGAGALPWGVYSADADRSGASGPADLLRVIDLLAGSDPFTNAWNDSCRPSAEGICP
jgi:hypothetical protein